MTELFAPLLQPLGFGWTLVVLYALWQLLRRRLSRALAAFLVAGTVFAIGSTPWPARLLATLERPYVRDNFTNLPPAEVVIMLGGVLQRSHHDVFGFELNDAADRVVTAVQAVHLTGAQALVLGGGVADPAEPDVVEGDLTKRWLAAWGQPGVPVYTLGPCGNTHDEAEHARALVETHHWKRIVLVTSAAHMRRSEAAFRKQGLDVRPLACDFRALSCLERGPTFAVFPKVEGFELLGNYLHHEIGWWVYRLREWI